jgi:hypothetical protein
MGRSDDAEGRVACHITPDPAAPERAERSSSLGLSGDFACFCVRWT